jgi:hypothetical protein
VVCLAGTDARGPVIAPTQISHKRVVKMSSALLYRLLLGTPLGRAFIPSCSVPGDTKLCASGAGSKLKRSDTLNGVDRRYFLSLADQICVRLQRKGEGRGRPATRPLHVT